MIHRVPATRTSPPAIRLPYQNRRIGQVLTARCCDAPAANVPDPSRVGNHVALCFHRQRSDVATRHRVNRAPSHAPCRPTAAHCSSPPAITPALFLQPPPQSSIAVHRVTQAKGTPAATARPIISWASCALVRKATPSGTPASCRRTQSAAHSWRSRAPGWPGILRSDSSTAVPPLYPHRLLALPPAKHPSGIAQMLHHACRSSRTWSASQWYTARNPIGRSVPSVFGQLPSTCIHRPQQSLQIRQNPDETHCG